MGARIYRAMKWMAPTGMAAVLLTGFGVATASGADPFSGKNGRIAVVKSKGNADYMGVLSRKGNFRNFYKATYDDPFDPDDIYDVAFSPSGKQVVFSHGWRPTYLSIASAKSGRSRYIPTGNIDGYDPSWGSNGRITFNGSTAVSNRRKGTYSVRPDGKGRHRLFKRTYLAVSLDQNYFVAAGDKVTSHHLDLLDRDGRFVRKLVSDENHFFSGPAFSPNGRWIVFQRMPSGREVYEGGDLFMVRRDGTHMRRLTTRNRDSWPTFSPDGRWVAFIRSGKSQNLYSNVAVLPLKHPSKARRVSRARKTIYFDLSWGRRLR